ncbi:MAG: NUDIX hydrolase [Bacilli bacterium]
MSYTNNLMETLICLFTIKNGIFQILLLRKKSDPYKGYWILPGNILLDNETLEQNVEGITQTKIGLKTIYKKQCYTFSNINRYPNKRVLAVAYIGLIDSSSILLKMQEIPGIEKKWFNINELPKLGYDHEIIVKKCIERLQYLMREPDIFIKLFPSDFTLPELQKVYEQILNKKLDRRNFRKKIINLNLIEDTGYKNEIGNGRPAKLYRFKETFIKQLN